MTFPIVLFLALAIDQSWAAAQGFKQPIRLRADTLAMHCADFSPDVSLLAIGTGHDIPPQKPQKLPYIIFVDCKVIVFEVRTGKPVFELTAGHDLPVTGVKFSSDGSRLVTRGLRSIVLWDTDSRRRIWSQCLEENALGSWGSPIALSDRLFAFVSHDGEGSKLVIRTLKTGELVFETFLKSTHVIHSVHLSQNGDRLWVGFGNGILNLYDLEKKGNMIATARLLANAIESQGDHLWTALGDGRLQRWLATGGKMRPMEQCQLDAIGIECCTRTKELLTWSTFAVNLSNFDLSKARSIHKAGKNSVLTAKCYMNDIFVVTFGNVEAGVIHRYPDAFSK